MMVGGSAPNAAAPQCPSFLASALCPLARHFHPSPDPPHPPPDSLERARL